MSTFFRVLFLLPLFWLSSCKEEGVSREEERFRNEVDRRVEVIRGEMKVSESRWHTVRIVTFCLLAGGSLIWLFNGGGVIGRESKSVEPGYRRRVIDRPYEDDEPDEYPYRR
jgi:hypothetical protein